MNKATQSPANNRKASSYCRAKLLIKPCPVMHTSFLQLLPATIFPQLRERSWQGRERSWGRVRKRTFTRKQSRENILAGTFTRERSQESVREKTFTRKRSRKSVREGAFAREHSRENVCEGRRGSERSRGSFREGWPSGPPYSSSTCELHVVEPIQSVILIPKAHG